MSALSNINHRRSNLDKRAGGRLIFSAGVLRRSYLPQAGLAAARTAVLAFSEVVIPALAMLTVCCSITSCIAVRSDSSILSNSSMAQIPISASTSAPPSRTISLVTGSFCTAAVRPTPLLPLPVV
uniref:Uncharacterized protein n=1 Tax=Opuntia streptacantha TaxID=393608 RepID=A0A7C9ELW2_OPUST